VKRFAVYVLPIVAYAGLIFYLSSRSSLPVSLPRFFGADKVAHFVEYGILGFLLVRALAGYKVALHRAVWVAITLALAYGISDEVHQAFTPGREPSVWDVVADLLGAAAGVLAWYGLTVHRRRGADR
jgi:VanZ family protein